MFETFLINLDKDQERLDFMSNQLFNSGIFFGRISAIYGKEYKGEEYDEKLAIKLNGFPLMKSEVGCALSHKRCYEKFLESDLKYCLILEDDVLLGNNFKDLIEKEISKNEDYFLKHKEYNWEYLQLDYWDPEIFWKKRWLTQVRNTLKNKKGIFKKNFFLLQTFIKIPFVLTFAFFEILRSKIIVGPVKFYRDVYLAGAYIINKEGAQKLLTLSQKIIYTADKLQNQAKKQKGLKVKCYNPVIVNQKKDLFNTNIF